MIRKLYNSTSVKSGRKISFFFILLDMYSYDVSYSSSRIDTGELFSFCSDLPEWLVVQPSCYLIKYCSRTRQIGDEDITRMALIGNIGQFDPMVDQWSSFKERLEQFYAANEVAAEKHVAVLLSVIGGPTYELLRTLTAPARPAEKTFVELCEILENHLAPRPLVIAERFRFHKRNQQKNENISQFCVAIQRLSEHCQFGATLNDALRDRLVCGLVSEQIQRRLLTEAELTYDRARAIAIAAETATKDAEELRQQQPPADTVNKIKSNNHGAGATAKDTADMFCTRCGKRNHDQASCYFRDKFCLSCDKKGHTKRMCKTKVN